MKLISNQLNMTCDRTDISSTHGPGAEGDPAGFLLGAEVLSWLLDSLAILLWMWKYDCVTGVPFPKN